MPDAASYFLCINCFNSQDNAVKCHYYKLHFIDKEMESLYFQGHTSSMMEVELEPRYL